MYLYLHICTCMYVCIDIYTYTSMYIYVGFTATLTQVLEARVDVCDGISASSIPNSSVFLYNRDTLGRLKIDVARHSSDMLMLSEVTTVRRTGQPGVGATQTGATHTQDSDTPPTARRLHTQNLEQYRIHPLSDALERIGTTPRSCAAPHFCAGYIVKACDMSRLNVRG